MLGVNECQQYLGRLSGTPHVRTSPSQFRCVTTRKTRHEHVSTTSCLFKLSCQLRMIKSTFVVLFGFGRAWLKTSPFTCPLNATLRGLAGQEWHIVSHARPNGTSRLMTCTTRHVCRQPSSNFCQRNSSLTRLVVGRDYNLWHRPAVKIIILRLFGNINRQTTFKVFPNNLFLFNVNRCRCSNIP
jgi:hypothetical protein